MKTITVDFSSDRPIQPFYGGESGENRAVYLNVIPSADMTEDENIAIYYLAFTVEGGIMLSETFSPGEDISVSLGSVITEQRKLFFQLIATSADGESVISKSPMVQLFLGNSIQGDVIPDPSTGDTIYTEIAALVEAAEHIDLSDYYNKEQVDAIAITKVDKVEGKGLSTEDYTTAEKNKLDGINTADIAANTAARHTHSNKSVLDKFSESNDEPLYNGSPITDNNYTDTDKAKLDSINVADITANTAARHTHSNKSVLDKFGESSGTPTYDGQPIGGGGGTVTDVKDYGGNSLVNENGVANLPDYLTEEKQGVIELWKSDGVLNYTFAEITQFLVHNRTLTYYRDLVVKAEISGAPNTLKLYYLSADFFSNAYKIYYDEYSAPNQRIDRRHAIYTLSEEDFTTALKTKLDEIESGAQVNKIEKIKDSNGNELTITNKAVSLPAIPAAQIQSDWEQSDNTAKDYIKNKPSIPAAQVQADWNEADDTKADYIKNKPTIPDISGKEDTANKLKSVSGGGAGITSAATDTEYPSAKAVYDVVGDVEAALAALIGGES